MVDKQGNKLTNGVLRKTLAERGMEMNLPEGWPTEYEKFSTWWENQKSYMAASKFEYWECWQASALAAPTPPAQQDEPVAWLIPHVMEGMQISGKEIDISGSIGWSACIFCDTRTVARVNKNGSEFYPKPLYTRPDDKLRRAAEELIATYDFACKEDGCYASNNHVEALRAALEK
jgi:hypothetical protein